ncbi:MULTISPECIES: PRTRC system protein E [Acidithiobacillus]|uniref:PRTRC system protein E n=2 Tax=Acidithiobacillus TaxID=119977 RepID=A0A179BPK3_ACIFR|nr:MULTISPECIES: PRTRC system protein E [Acidithiobacillus]MEB8475577.1 PRTRC system protein E [Acidithiobacillus ferriphilus]MEB8487419.1 PRTRC system protein E [Acidithiobacillus ferriphilus]MEB8491394.1 PRTRC system protein E [Acidithiobacillus ferriphilus]MEB8493234.1 PRTRC system protein E [Acidithiobacillus ferriphilus]MEB8514876.1 PRTRC system protein E [Acidithiobacillus ferriphilus]
MFSELNDGQWNLMVTVKEGNGTVILMPAGEEKGAVKSPIRFTGTLGELDAQLPQMLTTVMAKRQSLQEQLDEQLKAAEAEAKASAPKKAASGGKTGSESTRPATPAPAPKSSETADEAGSFDLFGGDE